MNTYRITTGHASGIVTVADRIDLRPAGEAHRMLPGGWHAALATAEPNRAAVEIDLGAPQVAIDADTVRIRLPEATGTSASIAYVVYTAFERLRQQRRMLTLHGTAVHTPGGEAVLLLGAKAAGKTGTALALAERGWTHAGDDLVVLGQTADGPMIWPGKPTAAVRDPRDPLAPKTLLDLEPFAQTTAMLSRVVRVAVHPGVEVAALRAATPFTLNEQLRLHEDLGRSISGLPTPLSLHTPACTPVWPLDTPVRARWRGRLVEVLERSRFDYLYAPDPQAAADLLHATSVAA